MINEWNKDGPTVNEEVPGDEWYEREKAAFIAWWESEGQKKFGETPTLAAGAGWLARAEAVRSETVCRWIPVSERLPEIGKNLLVFRRDGEVFIDVRMCEPNDRHSHWSYANSDGVTHWMPLPEKP
jgi:hypothetical protein